MTVKIKQYQCSGCGMHYLDKSIAKQCEEFCKTHRACSIEIAKFSVEAGESSK